VRTSWSLKTLQEQTIMNGAQVGSSILQPAEAGKTNRPLL
jgi:hypothetical protein